MTSMPACDYVRVPRGTIVYPVGDGLPAPSARDQVVKVKRIFDVGATSEAFYLLLPDDMRQRHFEANGPVASDIFEFTDRLTKGDYRAVQWASKWALIADTAPAEAPARAKTGKKAVEKKVPLTKQDQLLPGSVWSFSQDAELRYKVRNPAYLNAREEVQNSFRQLPSHARTLAVDAKLAELGIVDYIDKPWGHVKAGETFTVLKKLTSGYAGGVDVPTLFRGERFTLPLSSLEPVIELVEAA
jgi:hypothetical protein